MICAQRQTANRWSAERHTPGAVKAGLLRAAVPQRLGTPARIVLAHTDSDGDDPVPSSYLASKGIKRKARRAQTCSATATACTAVLGTRCLVCATRGVFARCEASDDEAVGKYA